MVLGALRQASVVLAVVIAGCGAAADEAHYEDARDTSLAVGDVHALLVSITQPTTGPAKGASTVAPTTVFSAVPPTVRLIAEDDGLLFAPMGSTQFQAQVDVATAGQSKCIQVMARRASDLYPVPFEFGVALEGELDPCTGEALEVPYLDLTVGAPPPPQAIYVWHRICDANGKNCKWMRFKVRRAGGVD